MSQPLNGNILVHTDTFLKKTSIYSEESQDSKSDNIIYVILHLGHTKQLEKK